MEHQNIEKLSLDDSNFATRSVIQGHFALFCFALFWVGLLATLAIVFFGYLVTSQGATLSEVIRFGLVTLAVIGIFVWLLKTRFHLAKTMYRNRTFLGAMAMCCSILGRGVGHGLLGACWAAYGGFPELLDESIYRPDQESLDVMAGVKPSFMPSMPIYKISFSGPESDRPTVYFMHNYQNLSDLSAEIYLDYSKSGGGRDGGGRGVHR